MSCYRCGQPQSAHAERHPPACRNFAPGHDKPYSPDELRRIALVSDGDYMMTDGETAYMVTRRLLATIEARDSEIRKLREELRRTIGGGA